MNTALYEEFVYGDDGSFLSGTFADYIVGTAHDIPRFMSLHPAKVSASPWTGFGAKGVSEGNTTSTPVCVANAVADALGRNDIRLPLPAIPRRGIVLRGKASRAMRLPAKARGGLSLIGRGSVVVPCVATQVFAMLLDPRVLRRSFRLSRLDVVGPNSYRAEVSLGPGRAADDSMPSAAL